LRRRSHKPPPPPASPNRTRTVGLTAGRGGGGKGLYPARHTCAAAHSASPRRSESVFAPPAASMGSLAGAGSAIGRVRPRGGAQSANSRSAGRAGARTARPDDRPRRLGNRMCGAVRSATARDVARGTVSRRFSPRSARAQAPTVRRGAPRVRGALRRCLRRYHVSRAGFHPRPWRPRCSLVQGRGAAWAARLPTAAVGVMRAKLTMTRATPRPPGACKLLPVESCRTPPRRCWDP
jgi:hypothetical protein